MILANSSDKGLIVDLLTQAFFDNKSVNYIIKDDHNKLKRIRYLMDYSFRMCTLFGEVWLSDDKKACALIMYPSQKKTNLTSLWLNIKLIFQVVGPGNIARTLKREELIRQKQTEISMSYLWFIGVDPANQHKGIGSNLLREIIQHSEKMNLPLYLETSSLKNISWYEDFGFEVYEHLDLGYHLFFLHRG